MKFLKALGALGVLVAVLAGVPLALLAWGSPLDLLSVDWSLALRVPDDGTITLAVLSVVGWVAWGLVLTTCAAELLAVVSRGRVRIRVPLTGWFRPVVAALVAAAMAPVLVSGQAMADTVAPPAVAVSAPVTAGVGSGVAVAASPLGESAQEAGALPTHVVEAGDELWSLAERYLGDGGQWREILAANPGMGPDSVLHPGDVISLPAGSLVEVASATEGSEVTVETGDTMWSLAADHLGDGSQWRSLYEANRDIVADPDVIDVGWELRLPEGDAGPRPEAAAPVATTTPSQSPTTPAVEEPSLPVEASETPADSAAADPAVHTGPTAAEVTNSHTSRPLRSVSASETVAMPTSATAPTALAEPTPSRVAPDTTTETNLGEALESASVLPSTAVPQPDEVLTEGSAVTSSVESAEAPTARISEVGQRMLGPIGGLLAASVVGGFVARRRAQLQQRPIGRRVAQPSAESAQVWSALVSAADEAGPLPDAPTRVVLGWRADSPVERDIESARHTTISGSPDHASAMTGALLTSLICAPWSSGVDLLVVSPEADWEAALDDPRVTCLDDVASGLSELQRQCAGRRIQLGAETLSAVRADPDLAPVWQPLVVVFCSPLTSAQLAKVDECLSLGEVGVSVISTASPMAPDGTVRIESDTVARDEAGPFEPQLLAAPARRAVVELIATATSQDTEPAPWFGEPLPHNVTVLHDHPGSDLLKDIPMQSWSSGTDHPALLLLGPVELVGARGVVPSRAVGQCLQYCAWLLENPGGTPSQMVSDLLVAETTRRTNVSRLRLWLGADESEAQYLPDGYSGRLELDPRVTSDWERFGVLVQGKISMTSSKLLAEALELVRGEPLQGYGFQWGWAETMRTTMVSMIVDAAATLADRSIESGQLDVAERAISQGLLAAPDDEALAARNIHLLALSGIRSSVDSAVLKLTRAARAAGRDLLPENVRRIQLAMHIAATGTVGVSAP